MKTHIRLLSFILVILLIASMFTGCQKKELATIRLNEVVRSIFYTPQYVAINKGFLLSKVSTSN